MKNMQNTQAAPTKAPPTKKQIGATMRRARAAGSITGDRSVADMQEEIGCSRGTLWRIEAGKYDLDSVTFFQLLRLERVYGQDELGLREAIAHAEQVAHRKIEAKQARRAR